MINTEVNLRVLGQQAKSAATALARTSTAQKNAALLAMADALEANRAHILTENALDLADGQANGLTDALLDRLNLQKRLDAIIADVRSVATLPDPVGEVIDQRVLENGLKISRRRTPIGVFGVIYEARPNVTVDVAALTVKSGNAAILRGGKETLRTNIVLVNVMRQAIVSVGLPEHSLQYIESTDRRYVTELLRLHDYVDIIIPRGGNELHKLCRENATIPVITGGIGVCHLYVDEYADFDKSLPIIHNAKTSRPSVCNSLDNVLVHQSVAAEFLPRVVEYLAKDGVTFRADARAYEYVKDYDAVQPAGEQDFDTEWMTLICGLKVVNALDEAINHIQAHSLGHSDGILTENAERAVQFLNEVDSAAVFWNASTRFNDGGQFGLGAELAVSTQKLHARGPIALEGMTTYKWVVEGDGQIRT
ncbi:MAG: glutamate-5-semialdehyde dehydrogenase [Phototrophicaceae bacterium]|jgi:glutamate-5-semialdehyde dehydrogenase